MKNAYRINHRLEPGQYRLEDVFTDIRTYDILSDIFADAKEISGVMENIKVIMVDEPYEMFVDNNDGTITIGLKYLRCSPEEILWISFTSCATSSNTCKDEIFMMKGWLTWIEKPKSRPIK
jgi:hypothetical protein